MIKKKLREDPYKCLCGLARVGFITADSILLELEKVSKENVKNGKPAIIEFETELKTSKQRCLSCLLHLLEKNEEDGHTLMSINELRNQCMKLVPACSKHFVDCMKHESIYYDKDSMIVSLKNTYEIEKYIAERIVNGLANTRNRWDFDYKKYHIVNGCELSEEQLEIVKNICKYPFGPIHPLNVPIRIKYHPLHHLPVRFTALSITTSGTIHYLCMYRTHPISDYSLQKAEPAQNAAVSANS